MLTTLLLARHLCCCTLFAIWMEALLRARFFRIYIKGIMRSSIWIADDDTDDIEMVKEALDRLGNTREIHTFLNGQHVRDAFLSPHIQNPKYLIIDSRMPKLGGMELVHFLLDRKLMSRLHILFWSGAYSPRERNFCSSHKLICREKPASFNTTVKMIAEVFTHLSPANTVNKPKIPGLYGRSK